MQAHRDEKKAWRSIQQLPVNPRACMTSNHADVGLHQRSSGDIAWYQRLIISMMSLWWLPDKHRL
jgi:hypothetical protein